MPVFGTVAIRDMFPAMEDIVSQLVTKWERFVTFLQRSQACFERLARRFGPDHVIDPAKDYTKLTLDAIALASMSYRMNSFYSVSRKSISPVYADPASGRHGALRGCVEWGSQGVPTPSYPSTYRNGSNDRYSGTVRGGYYLDDRYRTCSYAL